jgi:hypothetical protein
VPRQGGPGTILIYSVSLTRFVLPFLILIFVLVLAIVVVAAGAEIGAEPVAVAAAAVVVRRTGNKEGMAGIRRPLRDRAEPRNEPMEDVLDRARAGPSEGLCGGTPSVSAVRRRNLGTGLAVARAPCSSHLDFSLLLLLLVIAR